MARSPKLIPTAAGTWKYLAWPVAIVVIALLFRVQIANMLKNPDQLSIEGKGVKFSFKAKNIPQPPQNVKPLLPQLDPEMVQYIVANVGGNNTPEICYDEHGRDYELKDENSVTLRLVKRKLIRIEPLPNVEPAGPCKPEKTCPARAKTIFIDPYDLVRNYLIDVLKSVSYQAQ